MKPKRKQRTPSEIIGDDRLMQLLFEGYAVIPSGERVFKEMCGDQIKGDVSWTYQWGDDGPSGGFTKMHTDAAERRIAESAQAVIFHAMSDGSAKLTLTATRQDLRNSAKS